MTPMTDQSIKAEKILVQDPAEILEMEKETLVDLYIQTSEEMEGLEAQAKAIKDVLFEKITGNGEVIGDHAVTKAKRYSFSEVSVEQAGELGAVKVARDDSKLKILVEKGITIPHTITEYLLIKEVKKEPTV